MADWKKGLSVATILLHCSIMLVKMGRVSGGLLYISVPLILFAVIFILWKVIDIKTAICRMKS